MVRFCSKYGSMSSRIEQENFRHVYFITYVYSIRDDTALVYMHKRVPCIYRSSGCTWICGEEYVNGSVSRWWRDLSKLELTCHSTRGWIPKYSTKMCSFNSGVCRRSEEILSPGGYYNVDIRRINMHIRVLRKFGNAALFAFSRVWCCGWGLGVSYGCVWGFLPFGSAVWNPVFFLSFGTRK